MTAEQIGPHVGMGCQGNLRFRESGWFSSHLGEEIDSHAWWVRHLQSFTVPRCVGSKNRVFQCSDEFPAQSVRRQFVALDNTRDPQLSSSECDGWLITVPWGKHHWYAHPERAHHRSMTGVAQH